MKKNIDQFLRELDLNHYLSSEDIPDIDLYMDQVIQLFEKKFAGNKRNDDEKVLTKTMINNYAKGKLFFPIQNKRYTKEHLMLISLIYHLKPILSIGDIKELLEPLNKKVAAGEMNLDQLYDHFLQIRAKDADKAKTFMHENVQLTDELSNLYEGDEQDYVHRLLLIASFANISQFYKRAAERLIDDMDEAADKNSPKN